MPRPGTRWRARRDCAAISSITSGMVSRTFPRRSPIGCCGSLGVAASGRSPHAGGWQRHQRQPLLRDGRVAGTAQPPAVVSTTTFGPSQRVRRERRRRLEGLLDGAARVTPACRQETSKILSFAASAPVWLAAARAPASVAPTLDDDQRLARGDRRESLDQGAAVDESPRVGERHCGGRVVGVPVEVIRRRHRRGRCQRTARLRHNARLPCIVRKLDTKLPLWLATAMRPGGGYGATICAHSDTGC